MEITSNYSIFDYASLQQTGREQMSLTALSSGLDFYENGDYKRAVQEFQRSIALSPFNENVIDTYNYMANAFIKLDDPESAAKAYKTAISVDPQREDVYLSLGNLYFSEEKLPQAEQAYKNAVRVYPSSETYYSLAHCSLEMEKLNEAEQYFEKVIRMEPKSENGYYGLGMTLAKKGEHEKAIEQFEKALRINPDFDNARVEMGYSLSDIGDRENANEQYDILEKNESTLSSMLYAYMYKVENPKFISADQGSFNWNLNMRMPISGLDLYLRNAGETRNFTVSFTFSKDMDVQSVQNPNSWNISKARGYGPEAYNYGLKSFANETEIPDRPLNILYDPATRTAAVTFSLSQNDYADGIIDAGHIVFSFSGTDRFGLTMDEKYDSFCGFNGFV